MNSRWSWLFTLLVLFGANILPTMSQSADDSVPKVYYDPDGTVRTYSVDGSEMIPKKKAPMVGPIIGAALGGLVFILLLIIIYNRIRHRNAVRQLEEGLAPSDKRVSKSGRKWLSKVGRFHRLSRGKRRPSDIEVRTPITPSMPVSAIPRYLRTAGKTPLGPLPPTLAYPRSARVMGNGNNSLMFTVPSDHSPTRVSLVPSITDSIRSMEKTERRKAQVTPQPVLIGNPFPSMPSAKRAILPPGYTGAEKPPASADIAWKLHETQRAVADLEAKSRWHMQHAHPNAPPHSASCAVDVQLERDIAELTHDVRVLESMLPPGDGVAPPRYHH